MSCSSASRAPRGRGVGEGSDLHAAASSASRKPQAFLAAPRPSQTSRTSWTRRAPARAGRAATRERACGWEGRGRWASTPAAVQGSSRSAATFLRVVRPARRCQPPRQRPIPLTRWEAAVQANDMVQRESFCRASRLSHGDRESSRAQNCHVRAGAPPRANSVAQLSACRGSAQLQESVETSDSPIGHLWEPWQAPRHAARQLSPPLLLCHLHTRAHHPGCPAASRVHRNPVHRKLPAPRYVAGGWRAYSRHVGRTRSSNASFSALHINRDQGIMQCSSVAPPRHHGTSAAPPRRHVTPLGSATPSQCAARRWA